MKFFTINTPHKADTAKIRITTKYFLHECFFSIFYFIHLSNFLSIFFKTFCMFFSAYSIAFSAPKNSVLDRNLHKLMKYFTQVFRNVANYLFFQQNSKCKLVMRIFSLQSKNILAKACNICLVILCQRYLCQSTCLLSYYFVSYL